MHKPGTLLQFKPEEFEDGFWGPKEKAIYGSTVGELLSCESSSGKHNQNCIFVVFFHGPNVNKVERYWCHRFEIVFEPKD